jgi:hypothetical protein
LNHERPELLVGERVVVDFGFGQSAVTTQEWRASIVDPRVRVIGVEREVTAPLAGIELVQGGFETCGSLGPASVVRAMNVLRGYREDEVAPARAALLSALEPGGLLLEGSSDTEGHLLALSLLQPGADREGLLFFTDFSRGFSPWLFRDWLPRHLRRSVKPGTAIHDLFSRWEARAAATRTTDPRERFLASLGDDVEATPWECEHGFARATQAFQPVAK